MGMITDTGTNEDYCDCHKRCEKCGKKKQVDVPSYYDLIPHIPSFREYQTSDNPFPKPTVTC